jgi:putative flippase GtrA
VLVQLIKSMYARWRTLVHELAKFGTVGLFCYIVDVAISNVLHVNVGMGPTTSKIISTVVAATLAYFGNRIWSFKHRARSGVGREYTLFAVLNAIGLVITLAFTDFGYYVLHQHSHIAYNVWSNLIGTGFATVFRFWAYKKFVFLHPENPKARESVEVINERLSSRQSVG